MQFIVVFKLFYHTSSFVEGLEIELVYASIAIL